MKTRDELWRDCSRHFSRGEVFERARQNFSGVLFSPNQKLFFVFFPLYLIGGFIGIESRNLKIIHNSGNKNVQIKIFYWLTLLLLLYLLYKFGTPLF